MSSGTLYTFRIKDAEIDQTLAAMPGRLDFIRRAVVETLSADDESVDDLRRLREGLISIANSRIP